MYILAFIIQIILMVKCFKHKVKWRILLIFETICILIAMFIGNYYSSLPGYGFMPGLTYLGQVMVSYISMIIYIIMFCVTLLIKTILYLRKKKEEGKDYFPIIKLVIRIMGIIILGIGIVSWIICTIYNYNIGEASAAIIDNMMDESKWYHPVVQYNVDGITYTAINTNISSMQKLSINHEITIYYNKNNPNKIETIAEHEEVPFLILGSFMFIISIIGKRKCNIK